MSYFVIFLVFLAGCVLTAGIIFLGIYIYVRRITKIHNEEHKVGDELIKKSDRFRETAETYTKMGMYKDARECLDEAERALNDTKAERHDARKRIGKRLK